MNALYAFGALDAMGFSPFAIETNDGPAAGYLTASFDVVRQLTPLLVDKQGRGLTAGFLQESAETKQPSQVRLGRWIFHVSFERAAPPQLADGLAVVIGTENSALAAGGRAGTAPAGAGVLVARYVLKRTTQVKGGEDVGKSAIDVNAVTSLKMIGDWTGKPATFAIEPPAADEGLAVLVQAPDGRFLGAASVEGPATSPPPAPRA